MKPIQSFTHRCISLTTVPMAQSCQIEGRLKRVLDKKATRNMLTHKYMVMASILALVMVTALATIRPAARAASDAQMSYHSIGTGLGDDERAQLSNRWAIHGDVTIVYHARGHAIAEHVVIPEANQQGLARSYRAYSLNRGIKVTDAQVKQFVKQQVEGSEAPVDTTPFSFSIIESVRNHSFLYKFVRDNSNKPKRSYLSNVLLYNGTQSISGLTPSKHSLDYEVEIHRGLEVGDLFDFFPICCTGLGGIQFIKDIMPMGGDTYHALVLQSNGSGPIPYWPSILKTHMSIHSPQISHITMRNDHMKYETWTFTGGVMDGSVEIPQHIHEVRYDPFNGDHPVWVCNYTLQSLTNKPLPSLDFSIYSILNKYSQIRAKLHGVDIVVLGYRSNMSLAAQEQQAYLERQGYLEQVEMRHLGLP